MNDFAGQRILLTGGSQGIGHACARRFAASGARVVINYARDPAAADAAVAGIRAAGGDCRAVRADLGEAAEVERLWCEATAEGPLDALVLNAAFQRKATLEETDLDLLRRTLAVNVVACFDLAKRFIAARRAVGGGGAIVVHGSNQGELVMPTGLAYGVSKAALHHLVRHLAAAAARDRVRVNGVVLGWFDTEGERRTYGQAEIRAQAARTIPLGRIGEAEEAAAFTAFLAGAGASYITGSLLRCDGGFALAPDLAT